MCFMEWATFKRSNKNKSAEKLIRDNLVLKCCSWPQNPCFWRANQAKSETFVWWCDFISVYFSVIMCLSQLMWKLCCIIKLLLKRVKGLFCKKVQIWTVGLWVGSSSPDETFLQTRLWNIFTRAEVDSVILAMVLFWTTGAVKRFLSLGRCFFILCFVETHVTVTLSKVWLLLWIFI